MRNGNHDPQEPVIVSASWLAEHQFPAQQWVVEDLIPVGLTVLASAPKIGKSFFVLQACFCVSHGTPTFWQYQTDPGPSLYLDLELPPPDSKRRMLKYQAAHKVEIPSNMFFAHEWPQIGHGGLTQLEEILEKHSPRIVAIDVISKLWPSNMRGGNAYHTEYALLSKIKRLADQHGTGIVLCHHQSKLRDAADVLHTVSGTQAMVGVADCVMVIQRERGKAGARLFVTGRKVREREIEMSFDSLLASWQVLDDPLRRGRQPDGASAENSEGIEPGTGDRLQEGNAGNSGAHHGDGPIHGQVHDRAAQRVADEVHGDEEGTSDQRGLFSTGGDHPGGEGGAVGDVGDGDIPF